MAPSNMNDGRKYSTHIAPATIDVDIISPKFPAKKLSTSYDRSEIENQWRNDLRRYSTIEELPANSQLPGRSKLRMRQIYSYIYYLLFE